jgi:hypothetical protein
MKWSGISSISKLRSVKRNLQKFYKNLAYLNKVDFHNNYLTFIEL